MTQYTAVVNQQRIITVIAESEEEARSQVRIELNRNPSRRPYLTAWVNAGEQLITPDYGNVR